MDRATLEAVREAQRAEITEYRIYRALSRRMGSEHNRELLARIGDEEKAHHDFLAEISGEQVPPSRLLVWVYVLLARLLGVTFALKLMERGEKTAQLGYRQLSGIDGVERIIQEEEEHERELLDLLEDERLQYAGSMVLGLNDALVELTGALAGLTLALADGRIVAVAGLVTGIAASLSMAASEYLSSKSEHEPGGMKSPLKAAVYTGTAYIIAVILLILPFFLAGSLFVALACTLAVAVVIIAVFTSYLSVARDLRFWPRFWEMALISLGVAAVSFGIGFVVRQVLGVEV